MNVTGAAAVVLSVAAFVAVYRLLRSRPARVRLLWLCVFMLLSVPALWFAVYYLHILPEDAWFYTLRSWPGSEFLAVFLGCAGGAAATLLPRWLPGVPLLAVVGLVAAPYIKPLIRPLSDDIFRERSRGEACLQSTGSTCGPASITTILRHLGVSTTEHTVARAAYTDTGGTEAWYLARYVRSRGLSAHFDFRDTFSPEVGQPALVGVRLGNIGHFIAVLDCHDDQVTYADPLHGEEHVSLAEFQRRYDFTGFHMVIQRD
jgi:hypothetical protein